MKQEITNGIVYRVQIHQYIGGGGFTRTKSHSPLYPSSSAVILLRSYRLAQPGSGRLSNMHRVFFFLIRQGVFFGARFFVFDSV